jgi:hypothetical protein
MKSFHDQLCSRPKRKANSISLAYLYEERINPAKSAIFLANLMTAWGKADGAAL